MNDTSVFIYFLCFACLAGATFAYMYAMMTSTLRDFNRQQERRNVHPEMSDVQSGADCVQGVVSTTVHPLQKHGCASDV